MSFTDFHKEQQTAGCQQNESGARGELPASQADNLAASGTDRQSSYAVGSLPRSPANPKLHLQFIEPQ